MPLSLRGVRSLCLPTGRNQCLKVYRKIHSTPEKDPSPEWALLTLLGRGPCKDTPGGALPLASAPFLSFRHGQWADQTHTHTLDLHSYVLPTSLLLLLLTLSLYCLCLDLSHAPSFCLSHSGRWFLTFVSACHWRADKAPRPWRTPGTATLLSPLPQFAWPSVPYPPFQGLTFLSIVWVFPLLPRAAFSASFLPVFPAMAASPPCNV